MSKQPTEHSNSPEVVEIIDNVTMSFDPFLVPVYAKVRHIGPFSSPSEMARIPVVPLSGLPDAILDRLVETLLKDIYAKAGRDNPFVHQTTIEWAKAAINGE